MKISYRTYPVLKKLESGDLGEIVGAREDLPDTRSLTEDFKQTWGNFSNAFSSNLQYITKPFEEAMLQATHKMLDTSLEEDFYSRESSGTLLADNQSICYHVKPEINGDCTIAYFRFSKTSTGLLTIDQFLNLTKKANNTLLGICYFSTRDKNLLQEGLRKGLKGEYNEGFHIGFVLANLVATVNFIRYAPVEIKQIGANKRVKEIDCKYVNESKSTVNFLSSTWFTTLVKSDAFKVRGHFRLQPKKHNGKWTKELIWISEYQKSGYTAPARKLNSTTDLN